MVGYVVSGVQGRLDVLADWLSARATLMLVLLMVQTGLLIALCQLSATAVTPSGAIVGRGSRAACGAYEIVFAPDASVSGVREWALNFDAQIVAGPNARGAFELSVPQLGTDALRRALGPLVEQVRVNALCPQRDAT
jgi:hypothetical protein